MLSRARDDVFGEASVGRRIEPRAAQAGEAHAAGGPVVDVREVGVEVAGVVG